MTTSTETVVNKPLSGSELRDLLRADFELLLGGEGLLSSYLAYGRISYDLTLRLHMDNPWNPESSITRRSPLRPDAGIEPPPLSIVDRIGDAVSTAVVGATNLFRRVDSPNAERLRAGLPLPVVVRQPDGTTTTELVKYPPQPDLGAGDVSIIDVSRAARTEWKLPEAKEPSA